MEPHFALAKEMPETEFGWQAKATIHPPTPVETICQAKHEKIAFSLAGFVYQILDQKRFLLHCKPEPTSCT